MTGGSYILKIKLGEDVDCNVGSLNEVTFEAGWYAYVGSSRTTDFKRVERHKKVDSGEKSTRHWHIDYLLGLTQSDLIGSYRTESDVECLLSENINLDYADDFGCSDCKCNSHLYFSDDKEDFDEKLADCFKQSDVKYIFSES